VKALQCHAARGSLEPVGERNTLRTQQGDAVNENQMIAQMLEAAGRGDMEEALRLQAHIKANTTFTEPGYTDDVQINSWGDRTSTIPDPDTIEDPQLAAYARKARKIVAEAKAAGTITAHVDAEQALRRIGYTGHAIAMNVRAKQLVS
jgi:hypothetical protein